MPSEWRSVPIAPVCAGTATTHRTCDPVKDGLKKLQAERITELEKQVAELTTQVGELNVANMKAQSQLAARAKG